MSNTQRKQAKRKARQKEQRKRRNDVVCIQLSPLGGRHLGWNIKASEWAQEAAEKAGLSEFEQEVASMVGQHMTSDTWELDAPLEDLVEGFAQYAGTTLAEIRKALVAIMEAGILTREVLPLQRSA